MELTYTERKELLQLVVAKCNDAWRVALGNEQVAHYTADLAFWLALEEKLINDGRNVVPA